MGICIFCKEDKPECDLFCDCCEDCDREINYPSSEFKGKGRKIKVINVFEDEVEDEEK